MTKQERIQKEYDRLAQYFCGLDKAKRETAEHLIQNTAFLTITLQDLQEVINKNGVVDEYQNGENQKGIKESAELRAYNSTFKSYTTACKQLFELTKDIESQNLKDGFKEKMAEIMGEPWDAEPWKA